MVLATTRAMLSDRWADRVTIVLIAMAVSLTIQVGLFATRFPARGILAGSLLVLFCVVAIFRPRMAIVLSFVWLSIIGDFRRLLDTQFPQAGSDPILLISPVVVALIVAGSFQRAFPADTRLSRFVLLLTFVALIQVLNPLQGGPVVGIAGMILVLPPLLWFWVGRVYGDARFVAMIMMRVVVPVSLIAGLLGFLQVQHEFLPYERSWLDRVASEYGALNVGGSIRPFAFFTSAAEYAQYLGIGTVLIVAARSHSTSRWFLVPPLFGSILLTGSRGVVVTTLITAGLLWTVQGSNPAAWFPRFFAVSVVGVFGTIWALRQLQSAVVAGPAAGLVEHQTSGLLNPLDQRESTLLLHFDLVIGGFRSALSNPLGRGLGATTIAAAKFGGSRSGTEVDLSNVFVSLGLVGGVLFALIIGFALATALRLWRRRRQAVLLAIFGVLIIQAGQWLNGGQYAISALVWFLVGSLDRLERKNGTAIRSDDRLPAVPN